MVLFTVYNFIVLLYYYPTICHLHNFSDKKFGGTGIWEILHNIFVWLSLDN
jgi:hypothetical protein